MGQQDYYLGAPIAPAELARLSYKERTEYVIAKINALGPSNDVELPLGGDEALDDAARAWMAETGADHGPATLYRILEALEDPCDEIRALVVGARGGELRVEDSAKGLWLADLARLLFGARGLRVVRGE